jgi:hypothetical protein
MNDLELLHYGLDRAGSTLWLGHESVETTAIYLQVDMKLKEQPVAKTNATDAVRDIGPSHYHDGGGVSAGSVRRRQVYFWRRADSTGFLEERNASRW